MACFVAFTDACPQESITPAGPVIWHTMAAIGVLIRDSPFASGLVAPTLHGAVPVIRIPDPDLLSKSLQGVTAAPFRIWKKVRGQKRRRQALGRLLDACRSGACVFASHSTRSHLADQITDRYVAEYCYGIVRRVGLVGQPEYAVYCPQLGREIMLARQRLVSLAWIVHCQRVFLQKAREAVGNVEALFIHDNLPFDRDEEIAVVQTLLNALDPGRVHFMTERKSFQFAPSDNLAAASNDFITGKDWTIQQWVWKEGRPKSFYMTMDEEDGSFKRYI